MLFHALGAGGRSPSCNKLIDEQTRRAWQPGKGVVVDLRLSHTGAFGNALQESPVLLRGTRHCGRVDGLVFEKAQITAESPRTRTREPRKGSRRDSAETGPETAVLPIV